MTTLTVKINERSDIGKAVINFLRTSSDISNNVKVIEEPEKPRYNALTEKTIRDARKGIGVSKVKNYKTFVSDILK